LFPSTKDFFGSISGYEKKDFALRAFGFYSSYDATGLNICLGICLWGLLYFYYRQFVFLILIAISFIATAYVSRFTMIFAVICFLLAFLFIFFSKNQKPSHKLLVPLIVIVAIYGFYQYAYPILEATFGLSDNDNEITQSYAIASHNILLNDMVFFPDNLLSTLLGEGIDPKETDIGYVKIVFMIGLSGLLMISSLFLYSFLYFRRKVAIINHDNNIKIIWGVVISLGLLMFIFNTKLLLLYSRGFQDTFTIVIFSLNKFLIRQNILNTS
jgi:hypothetical protein